jgi:BlaI family penicillinase repressor
MLLTYSTTVKYGGALMAPANTELTETEWIVIKSVWEKEPCTAPSVQKRLHSSTKWTYSTVRTIMDRMAAKGLLTARKVGKVTFFRSAITREQAQRRELLYTLKHAFNGALTPMVQCLLNTGNLSASELEDLETLIKAKRKGGK